MKQRLIDANIARRKVAAVVRLRAQTPEARALGNAIMSMLGDERQTPTIKVKCALPTQESEAFAALRRINEACVQFMAVTRQYKVDTLKAYSFAAEICGMTFVAPKKEVDNGNI